VNGTRVFYFGCWGDVGHYLWTPDGRRARSAGPFTALDLDGRFCPGVVGRTDRISPNVQPEGVAALHHANGWTVLAFWDRSVDRRRGSHSTYVIEGTHDFGEAVRISSAAFPRVWARYPFVSPLPEGSSP